MTFLTARVRSLRLAAQRLGLAVHPQRVGPAGAAAGLAGGVVVLALCAAAVPGRAPEHHVAAGRLARAVVATSPVSGAVGATPSAVVSSAPAPSAPATKAARRPSASATPTPAAQAPADVAPVSALALSGIPITALLAYQRAAAREAVRQPSCRLPWPLLAGIGRVESNHGRFAGAVLHSDGVSTPRIIGIPLDGHGTALIRDTDHGALDGDTVYDRAVGPMQFIPSTWATWGVDANHDGRKDPFNVFDAAAAAADYLCAAGRDLATISGQVQAVLSYNHSDAYVRSVLGLEKIYATATGVRVPILPTTPDPSATAPPAGTPPPTLPPVDPGPPRGVTPPAEPSPSPTHPPTRPPSTTPPAPASSTSASSAPSSSTAPSSAPASSTAPSSTGSSTASSAPPSSFGPSASPAATASG